MKIEGLYRAECLISLQIEVEACDNCQTEAEAHELVYAAARVYIDDYTDLPPGADLQVRVVGG